MEGHCGDCKHWGRPGETWSFRTCTKISQDHENATSDLAYEEEDMWVHQDDRPDPVDVEHMRANEQYRAAHPAVVQAGTFGRFRARSDFGCVLFEPRPTGDATQG